MIKNIKSFFAVVTLFVMLFSNSLVYAERGIDFSVTDIRLSNQFFKKGDSLTVYVDVTNFGDTVCQCGYVKINFISGALTQSNQTSVTSAWANPYLSGGKTITYNFPKIKATGEQITLTAICDPNFSVNELNENNNRMTKSFKLKEDNIDFNVNDLKIDKEDFKPNDEVSFKFNIVNNGNKDFSYGKIPFEMCIDGKFIAFEVVESLCKGESSQITTPKIKIQKNSFDASVSVNHYKKIKESDYDNNSVAKSISSIENESYNWESMKIGGGGYVSGCFAHDNGDIYARTDVGGAYYFDRNSQHWNQLFNSFSENESSLYSTQGITADPKNSDIIYAAVGIRIPGQAAFDEKNALLRSLNKGESWQDLKIPVRYRGSPKHHDVDNIICIDPNNSNVLYSGSNFDGLYMTENACEKVPKWTRVDLSGFTPSDSEESGIWSIAFDKTKTSDGRSAVIYVSVYNTGIYRSQNGGKTFEFMKESPMAVSSMSVGNDGILYVASDKEDGGVFNYYDEKWHDISPRSSCAFKCVDVSSLDSNMIAASGIYDLYVSFDKGLSWENIKKGTVNKQIQWTPDYYFGSNIAWVKFDPLDKKSVLFGDWFGVWKAVDVSEKDIIWEQKTDGIEEFCVFGMASFPKGETDSIIGAWDNSAVIKKNLFDFPYEKISFSTMHDARTIAYSYNNPDIIVIGGGQGHYSEGDGRGGFSIDNGKTFIEFKTYPTVNDKNVWIGNAAVSCDKNKDDKTTVLIGTTGSDKPYRTDDFGESWQVIDSLPKTGIAFGQGTSLIADKVNCNKFYYFDRTTGYFYVSVNGGKSFKKTCELAVGDASAFVSSFPNNEGYIIVSMNYNGLYFSSDSGKTFKKIENVSRAKLSDVGICKSGNNIGSVYIYGSVNSTTGVFRSDDLMKSWIKIGDDAYCMGNSATALTADQRRWGIVYISTNGSGVVMGVPSSTDVKPPELTIEKSKSIVRDSNYTITGFVSEKCSVTAICNDKVYKSDSDVSNKFSVSCPLEKGKNEIKVVATDLCQNVSKENKSEVEYNPDYVKIYLDQSDGISLKNTFDISGYVNCCNENNEILINNESVKLDKELKFSHTISLNENMNEILIRAFDENGNCDSEILKINYDLKKPKIIFENDNTVSYDKLCILKGSVSEPSVIKIGTRTLKITDEEKLDFSIPVALKEKNNSFFVTVTDCAGNVTEKTINIVFEKNNSFIEEDNIAVAKKATVVIDGVLDEEQWITDRVASKIYTGSTDNAVKFGFLYDDNYLYLGIKVYDNAIKIGDEPDPSNYVIDGVEICFDPELNRATKYDDLDRQLRLDLYGDVFDCKVNKTVPESKSACTILDDGYIIETAIPLSYLSISNKVGDSFGFDLSVNDCDDDLSSNRNGIVGWCSNSDNWSNTSNFGTVYMGKR